MPCILAAEPSSVGGSNCSASDGFAPGCAVYGAPIETRCAASAFPLFRGYEHAFQGIVSAAATYSKPGNGAFIHSCFTHCEASQGLYNTIKQGNTTLQQARALPRARACLRASIPR